MEQRRLEHSSSVRECVFRWNSVQEAAAEPRVGPRWDRHSKTVWQGQSNSCTPKQSTGRARAYFYSKIYISLFLRTVGEIFFLLPSVCIFYLSFFPPLYFSFYFLFSFLLFLFLFFCFVLFFKGREHFSWWMLKYFL